MEWLTSPHDLLRIAPTTWDDAPAWVAAALQRAPFVVVRRGSPVGDGSLRSVAPYDLSAHDLASCDARADAPSAQGAPGHERAAPGLIAVGVRGLTRSERFGTRLDSGRILEVIRPETLRTVAPARALPVFAALARIAPICEATGFAWGPTGSVGFELASGIATASEASDLDLLMRVPARLEQQVAMGWLERLEAAAGATRIDVQIETGEGAFSLAEFAGSRGRVLMRRADGPVRFAEPWAAREEQRA
jgi:phosphoribosyl-dephospho-CoA transferase